MTMIQSLEFSIIFKIALEFVFDEVGYIRSIAFLPLNMHWIFLGSKSDT